MGHQEESADQSSSAAETKVAKQATPTRFNPAERMATFFTNLTQKYVPDPFVLAISLTAVVAVAALVIERQSPADLITEWGDGFWGLLAFTTQMTVVLATGYVLAHTPLVDGLLDRIAARIPSPRMAIVAATLIGGLASYLNWGFGLVVGGVVATKLALGVRGVHYPLIIAAAYSGFTMYGFGLSASIPVTISTPGHPLEKQMGLVSLTETIWSPPMVITSILTMAVLVIVNPLLHPTDPAKVIEIDRSKHDTTHIAPAPTSDDQDGPRTLADRLNNSRIIAMGIGVVGIAYLVLHFAGGSGLDINTVNFALLFIGIILMKTAAAYVKMMAEAVKTVGGILLQYPFYAGIMAIMAGSGLVIRFGDVFTDIASASTLPVLGVVSSFFINFFAPSAGGHWVIQGPFMIEAAANLNSSFAQNAMAVQLGNAWNDLVQPLWILPVLALSRLKLKDIMGYLVIVMMAVGVLYVAAILIWGAIGH